MPFRLNYQILRCAFDAELHRTFARRRNREQKRRAGPHAKHIRAVDAWRRGRGGRQNVRRNKCKLRLTADRGGFGSGSFKFSIRPIRMVETIAIASITDLERQRFHARQINFAILRRVARAHHAAAPKRLAIADHDELHAGCGIAVYLVIHADLRGKFLRAAADIYFQPAFRVRSESTLKFLAADGQRVAFNRLVFVRFTPALRRSSEVQVIQPDRFGGSHLWRKHGQRKSEREDKT